MSTFSEYFCLYTVNNNEIILIEHLPNSAGKTGIDHIHTTTLFKTFFYHENLLNCFVGHWSTSKSKIPSNGVMHFVSFLWYALYPFYQ